MIGRQFKYTNAGVRGDDRTVYFQFQILTDDKTFELEETLEFPTEILEAYETKQLIKALHIAIGMSYYKTFIPPEITHPYFMTEVEAAFWNTVFKNGYGEFLYTNSIEPEKLAKFFAQDGEEYANDQVVSPLVLSESALLGIGGGKDSIVAGELLKQLDIPVTGFVQATGEILGQTQSVASTMEIDLLPVKRLLDKQIIDMNKLDGAKNGHIPISLIFALVGSLLAVSKKSSYVIVANESSASIPQAKWGDLNINHQWSKSIEFERLLQDYLHTYVSKSLNYFSAIRPMQSMLVAKQFAKFPKYLDVFTSDNSLFKIQQSVREHPRWSVNSSKSLSSFILLAPWINKDRLISAFGMDFLNLPELENMIVDLLGLSDKTVLDCVGTPEELLASVISIKNRQEYADSYLVKYLAKNYNIDENVNTDNLMKLTEDAYPEKLKNRLINILENEK